MTTSATVVEGFQKAGWRVVQAAPLRGAGRWLATAPDRLATLELLGEGEGELARATLVAVVAPDALEAARTAGERLAALLALVAPTLLQAGWLANALRAPMPKTGESRQVVEAAGVQARLTRNRRRSTVTLMVRARR